MLFLLSKIALKWLKHRVAGELFPFLRNSLMLNPDRNEINPISKQTTHTKKIVRQKKEKSF